MKTVKTSTVPVYECFVNPETSLFWLKDRKQGVRSRLSSAGYNVDSRDATNVEMLIIKNRTLQYLLAVVWK